MDLSQHRTLYNLVNNTAGRYLLERLVEYVESLEAYAKRTPSIREGGGRHDEAGG